jgi:hypothetical protein
MNRDRRAPLPRPYRLRGAAGRPAIAAVMPAVERDDVAPWVVVAVRAWPGRVEDRLVAVRVGVQPYHVRLAREERPAA